MIDCGKLVEGETSILGITRPNDKKIKTKNRAYSNEWHFGEKFKPIYGG